MPKRIACNAKYINTGSVETAVIDSGARDSVTHLKAFSNTPLTVTAETGHRYRACGGEPVINCGSKNVTASDCEGNMLQFPVQVTDKITRTLLSVSKLCEQGHACYFGPAPAYSSYIIHDPDAVSIASCKMTPINLRGGGL